MNKKNKYEWSNEYIRSLRLQQGLTQHQVAKEIGISTRAYINFEQGRSQFRKSTQENIEAYFKNRLTHETKMEVIFDYLRIRIPLHDLNIVFNEILKINRKAFVSDEVKRYGYVGRYSIDLIQVYQSVPNDNRGILIEFSGQGCRQFETFLKQQQRSWFSFLKDCYAFQANVTRIDIAVNDYKEALPLKRV